MTTPTTPMAIPISSELLDSSRLAGGVATTMARLGVVAEDADAVKDNWVGGCGCCWDAWMDTTSGTVLIDADPLALGDADGGGGVVLRGSALETA